MRLQFNSRFDVLPVGEMEAYEVAEIKNEPMFFKSDVAYACDNGGPLTLEFVDLLPEAWRNDSLIIDSRVHMLMPGWYPCIPGWHLDDVPRTRPDGQPDHANPVYKAEHIMAIVGDCSITSFVVGQLELEDVPIGAGIVYGTWNRVINSLLGHLPIKEEPVPERRLLHFNWQSFHRGNPATKNGWRWFIRATRFSKEPVRNEIRNQVQVYLPAPEAGW